MNLNPKNKKLTTSSLQGKGDLVHLGIEEKPERALVRLLHLLHLLQSHAAHPYPLTSNPCLNPHPISSASFCFRATQLTLYP